MFLLELSSEDLVINIFPLHCLDIFKKNDIEARAETEIAILTLTGSVML